MVHKWEWQRESWPPPPFRLLEEDGRREEGGALAEVTRRSSNNSPACSRRERSASLWGGHGAPGPRTGGLGILDEPVVKRDLDLFDLFDTSRGDFM